LHWLRERPIGGIKGRYFIDLSLAVGRHPRRQAAKLLPMAYQNPG
jgi:hypothetical protein